MSDVGSPRTATAGVPSTDTPHRVRSADRRIHPASGRRRGRPGRPLRSRIAAETRADSLETEAAAPPYTTYGGMLKQPDKQKTSNDVPFLNREVTGLVGRHIWHGFVADNCNRLELSSLISSFGRGRKRLIDLPLEILKLDFDS